MFSKMGIRVIAAVVVMALLGGCAEINRRGGVVADVEDYVLFKAHTKSHRLFRSYMLIGVLLGAARQGGHNQTDKLAIKGNLEAALAVAYEAYACLYREDQNPKNWINQAVEAIGKYEATTFPAPTICQFFDEKMARLDYALFRLTLSALFNEKSNSQLANIRDKLVGEIPVVSASAKAAIFATRAVNQTTNIVDDLLNLSFNSLGPVVTLLPLYRDSLELNMWVVVDSLTRACQANPVPIPIDYTAGDKPAQFGMDCATLVYANYILSQGNGNLQQWREFISQMNYYGNSIDAFAPHFVLVSRLIWRSCKNILDADACKKIMIDAVNLSVDESLLVNLVITPGDNITPIKRSYSASIRGPSQVTRAPLPVAPSVASSPARNPVQSRDSEPTGSIQRQGTTGQSR